MSEYINPGSALPNYYQFPEFLLPMPISQTAKLAYMLLYDRARLSIKNNRIKNGVVYVNYTLESMAGALNKSVSTVKNVYNELTEAGLLIRSKGGYSKPNDLFVLLPSPRQISDFVKKSAVVKAEKCHDTGQETANTEGRNPAPNKVINNKNNNSKNNIVIPRSAYGLFKNIFLSDEEYERLKRECPTKLDDLIEQMSRYLAANGKRYENYEAALLNWAAKDKANTKPGFPDYSFKEGESF